MFTLIATFGKTIIETNSEIQSTLYARNFLAYNIPRDINVFVFRHLYDKMRFLRVIFVRKVSQNARQILDRSQHKSAIMLKSFYTFNEFIF